MVDSADSSLKDLRSKCGQTDKMAARINRVDSLVSLLLLNEGNNRLLLLI